MIAYPVVLIKSFNFKFRHKNSRRYNQKFWDNLQQAICEVRKNNEHHGQVYESLKSGSDSQSDADKPNQLIFLMEEVQEAKHLRKSYDTVDFPNSSDSCYAVETALTIHEVKRYHWYEINEEPAHQVSFGNFLYQSLFYLNGIPSCLW